MRKLILDEVVYAESLLSKGSSNSYPLLEDIILLGKYWKHEGLETHEIRLKLEEYCLKTDKYWNKVLLGWEIEKSLNTLKRYRIKTSFPVTITKKEVETIKQFDSYDYQRILFVLLVYAKFLKYSNTKITPTQKTYAIGKFYVKETMTNIVKIAKVSMRKKERDAFFHKLYEKGMFDYTFHDSLLIKYVNENSDPEIIVEDFDDITLYWARYCGQKIAACSNCGKLFIKKSNRHSYCRICWAERKNELQKGYMKEKRK